ncbi:hypothetical protein BDV11DRAFT_170972 [Aspergillus similis]
MTLRSTTVSPTRFVCPGNVRHSSSSEILYDPVTYGHFLGQPLLLLLHLPISGTSREVQAWEIVLKFKYSEADPWMAVLLSLPNLELAIDLRLAVYVQTQDSAVAALAMRVRHGLSPGSERLLFPGGIQKARFRRRFSRFPDYRAFVIPRGKSPVMDINTIKSCMQAIRATTIKHQGRRRRPKPSYPNAYRASIPPTSHACISTAVTGHLQDLVEEVTAPKLKVLEARDHAKIQDERLANLDEICRSKGVRVLHGIQLRSISSSKGKG